MDRADGMLVGREKCERIVNFCQLIDFKLNWNPYDIHSLYVNISFVRSFASISIISVGFMQWLLFFWTGWSLAIR